MMVMHLSTSYHHTPIGMVVCDDFFFALAINEQIAQTYLERDLLRENQKLQRLAIEAFQKQIAEIALHVAHDMRSPLAALATILFLFRLFKRA